MNQIDECRSIVSVLEDGSTSWCLGLYPTNDAATGWLSRWRPKFEMTPATFFHTMLSEPGTFIMQQKMLRLIRDRAERTPAGYAQIGTERAGPSGWPGAKHSGMTLSGQG